MRQESSADDGNVVLQRRCAGRGLACAREGDCESWVAVGLEGLGDGFVGLWTTPGAGDEDYGWFLHCEVLLIGALVLSWSF